MIAPLPSPAWLIQPLEKSHDRAHFDCGEPALDLFIQRLTRQQQEKHLGRTFVAVDAATSCRVIGYYTLSAGNIGFESLDPGLRERLPKYPIPVARIGRFAVDRTVQGQGLGHFLLKDGLLRIASLSTQIGINAVVVDAKHEKAKRFYRRFGFVEFQDAPLSLYLPLQTILQSLKQSAFSL